MKRIGSIPLDLTSSGMYTYGHKERPTNYQELIDDDTVETLLKLARELAENTEIHSEHDRKNWKNPHLMQIVYPAFRFGELNCFITNKNESIG